MKLHTSQETKKIDALAIRETEHTGYSLMQSAAEFSLDVLMNEFDNTDEVIVFLHDIVWLAIGDCWHLIKYITLFINMMIDLQNSETWFVSSEKVVEVKLGLVHSGYNYTYVLNIIRM